MFGIVCGFDFCLFAIGLEIVFCVGLSSWRVIEVLLCRDYFFLT